MINKYLLGGSILQRLQQLPPEQQLQFMQQFLIWAENKGLNLKAIANNPSELEKALQIFVNEMKNSSLNGTPSQKIGGKLDYLRGLKNVCKEGEELIYMKAGGTFCKKCEKRMQVQAKRGGGAVEEFKSKYDKCGGKIKKKEIGGQIPQQKKQQKPAQKPTQKKTPLPSNFNPKKAENLRNRFKKNGYKPLPKASMDSLQWYNRHDPNEQGV